MSDQTVEGVVLDPTPPQTPPSPKVIAGALLAFLVPLLLAALASLLRYVAGDGHWILAGLPPYVQALIVTVVSALASYIGGYTKRDAIREFGAKHLPVIRK